MRLDDYSLDDLHQFALAEAEHDNDEHAVALLNDVYDSLRREYVGAVRLMREHQGQEL
jgi:hypothetical protein